MGYRNRETGRRPLILVVAFVVLSGCSPSPADKAVEHLAQGRFHVASYSQSLDNLRQAQSAQKALSELENGWGHLTAASIAFGMDVSPLGQDAENAARGMRSWVEELQHAHIQVSRAYQQAVQVDRAIATPEYLLSSFVRGTQGDPFGATRDALAARQAAAYQWQASWSDLSATVQGGIGAMSALDRWMQAHPEHEDIFRRGHGVD